MAKLVHTVKDVEHERWRDKKASNTLIQQTECKAASSIKDAYDMMQKAIAYAKKSRFNYTSAAAQVQTGVIRYRFVAQ